MDQAVVYYKHAIELDRTFAKAWVGLSNARSNQAGHGFYPIRQGYQEAREAAEKALLLDQNLAAAHGALGMIRMSIDWDWERADASFKQELSLEPENPFAFAHIAYMDLVRHRFAEGMDHYRQAVDRDPLNPAANRDFGVMCLWQGQKSRV